jgi:transposase InsO family protein
VIGWAIADHMRTDLVEDALRMAIVLRGQLPDKVVFHADRGTQGGFNWSSQHLDDGGVDGKVGGMDDGADGTFGDEVSWGAVASTGSRAGILARDREGLAA